MLVLVDDVFDLPAVNWKPLIIKHLALLGVQGAYAGASHLMDAVLYGLLVDEQAGEDALGYEFPLNLEFDWGN